MRPRTTIATLVKRSPEMKTFVDTSAFYALADESDRHHARAKASYESLVNTRLASTDHVLIECWFLIGSRLGRDAAIRFWDGLRSEIVDMLIVTSADLDRAREIIGRLTRAFPTR